MFLSRITISKFMKEINGENQEEWVKILLEGTPIEKKQKKKEKNINPS